MGCVFFTLFEEKCILASTAFRIACLRCHFERNEMGHASGIECYVE